MTGYRCFILKYASVDNIPVASSYILPWIDRLAVDDRALEQIDLGEWENEGGRPAATEVSASRSSN